MHLDTYYLLGENLVGRLSAVSQNSAPDLYRASLFAFQSPTFE